MVLNRRKNTTNTKKLTRRFGSPFVEPPASSRVSNDNLTTKQRMFVSEYLIDYNATRAAIAAGYAPDTAAFYASNLIRRPVVEKAIQDRLRQLEKVATITRERVLEEYAKIAFVDPQKFYDEDGKLIPIPELDKDTAAAITTFNMATKFVNGEEHATVLKKIKLADKKAALDSLAKHLGMFIDRTEISGPDGKPIPMKVVHSLDEFRKMFPLQDSQPKLVDVKRLKKVNE